MRIPQKPAVVLAAAVALAGLTALGGGPATAAPRDPVAVSLQVSSDGTNLDEYEGGEVWTRDARLTFQDWVIGQLDDGSFRIKGTHYDRCVTDNGVGNPVTLKGCNANDPAQRWIFDIGSERTVVESVKDRRTGLQANGLNQPVTLEPLDDNPAQEWTPYQK
ncbi:ricin-type beta-trefoil lectin domain protein [Kitasatospora sp. NPDC091257]|uniref:ricin-type beta-trefoil lectin domain protein n=1 Tax=Kitasatospora sp. NPDC091257 TaxID=3364084 RepID=UPI003821E5BE